jgi:ribosome biogenesis GTPase
VEDSFGDVATLARRCRFSGCRHGGEPGCAVREAPETGMLPRERYENYMKLHSEASRLKARKEQRGILLARRRKRSTSY